MSPGKPTQIRDADAWRAYMRSVASRTEGNAGRSHPEAFPCIVVTHIEHHGSVTINSMDYEVDHVFLYPADVAELAAAESQPVDPATARRLSREGVGDWMRSLLGTPEGHGMTEEDIQEWVERPEAAPEEIEELWEPLPKKD